MNLRDYFRSQAVRNHLWFLPCWRTACDQICSRQICQLCRAPTLMINIFINFLCYLLVSTSIYSPVYADEDESACNPVYEINTEWKNLRLRPHENAFLSCHISLETFNRLINQALSDPDSRDIQYRSVFIGRLVEYPWLAQQLAERSLQHPAWDAESAQVRKGNLNQLVVSILSSPEILQPIQEPFLTFGYRVTGVSVEKVLVDHADNIPWLKIDQTDQVPYDAMVHFILEPSSAP